MSQQTETKIRRWILVILCLVIFGIFVAQLLQVQIVNAEKYRKKMDGRTLSSQIRKPVRGEIMDKNGAPIVINEMGHSILLDRPFLPRGIEQNNTILKLMASFEDLNEEWIDNLPIRETAPYAFYENREDDVKRLKSHLNTQPYATAGDCMDWLIERYLLEEYTPKQQRKLAGVRYEMERRDFSNKTPYTFAADISLESVIFIKERSFELPGVTPEAQGIRKYAQDDFAPHILGAVGPLYEEEYSELKKEGKIFNDNAPEFDINGYLMDDSIGKSGVESALEYLLRGTNGKREISTDATGEIIESYDAIPPVPGNTVYLTLDAALQKTAQEALAAQIHYLQTDSPEINAREADAGAVAAIEMKTGRILALATNPTYTLTDYQTDYQELASREGSPLLDRSLFGRYSPGSIYKPVTGLTALQEQVATPSTHFFCGQTYEFFASSGYRPKCLSAHGNIDLGGALQESCNIYFYEAGRLSGIEALDKTARGLGLGEPTGIEISEFTGSRANPTTKEERGEGEWWAADTIQVAIGQFGSEFSPLQLANYAATLGNRGTRMKLSILNEVRDYSQNKIIQGFTPEIAYQMSDVSPEYFESIIDGMVRASSVGTARGTFGNYPIPVASKTGTPQTSGDQVNSTFIAFAPADDPQIAVVVVIEKGWHGYTGASVAKALFDEYFGIENVWAPVPNGPEIAKRQRMAEEAAKNKDNPTSESSASSESPAPYVPPRTNNTPPVLPQDTAEVTTPEPTPEDHSSSQNSAESKPESSVADTQANEKESSAPSSRAPSYESSGQGDVSPNVPPG